MSPAHAGMDRHLAKVRALADGHRLGITRLIPATELAALLNTFGEDPRG